MLRNRYAHISLTLSSVLWGELKTCALAQLSVLAAENAVLKAKLTEREQAAQLEMQDLRKFCIASQERDSEKDSVACKELQQQQQQMMGHLSTVESLANQAIAATQHISTRLEKVIPACVKQQAPTSLGCQQNASRLPKWVLLLPILLLTETAHAFSNIYDNASLMPSETAYLRRIAL